MELLGLVGAPRWSSGSRRLEANPEVAGDPKAHLNQRRWDAEESSGLRGPRVDGLVGRDRGDRNGRLGGTFMEAGEEVLADGELGGTRREGWSHI